MYEDDLKHNAGRKLALQNLPLTAMEVHSDRKARYSGQVFIEVSCHGKESGIVTTRARYWAIELHDSSWAIVPTSRLKEVVLRQQILRGTVRGGDGGAAEGVLLQINALFLEPRKPKAADAAPLFQENA